MIRILRMKDMALNHRMYLTVLVVMTLSSLLTITSCVGSDSPKYSRFVSIDPDGWTNSEYCVFRLSEADSAAFVSPSRRYDVILSVRHTTDYPYNNLWIVLEKPVTPDSILSSKVNLRLADPSGSWRGHGMQGLYEFSDTVIRGMALSSHDVISVRHDMPETSLPGLIDLGLTIVEASDAPH